MAPKRKLKSNKAKDVKSTSSEDGSPAKKSQKKDTTSDKKTGSSESSTFKALSWNVDGLRAWVKKDGISVVKKEDPDIVCFQELKCTEAKLPPEFTKFMKDYHSYIFSAEKEGYSGVALLSKEKPLSVKKGLGDTVHDAEGRCITAEFEEFYFITAYVPNAGKKLVTLDKRMDWDKKLEKHLKELDEKKPLIYCGDLNVAHKEIDLKNPKTNKKNAGFTQEERDGFTNLLEQGFVDSYRELYPDKENQYTFWTYMMNARAKNVGWRLDYFVLSKRILPNMVDNIILSSAMGSDHCPIKLLMNFDKE